MLTTDDTEYTDLFKKIFDGVDGEALFAHRLLRYSQMRFWEGSEGIQYLIVSVKFEGLFNNYYFFEQINCRAGR